MPLKALETATHALHNPSKRGRGFERAQNAGPVGSRVVLALLALSLSSPIWSPSVASAQTGPRRISVTAYPIHIDDFTLPHNQTVDYRTSGTTPGVDPVMHLMRRSGSTWQHVTSNDNWSTDLEARISHTNTTGSTQHYLIVVRSKDGLLGLTNVLRNGLDRTTGAPVMGQFIPASALGFGSTDEVRTNHLPGQSVAHVLFSLTTTSGLTVGRFGYMNTPGRAARISATTLGVDKHFLVGTPWVQTDSGYVTPRWGTARLFGNDIAPGSDSDGDGVGDLLEQLIGTCPSGTCPPYGYLAKDSDRDGLTDGEELWGVAGLSSQGLDDVAFARWGADPLRKDVFVEVDWIADYGLKAPGSGIPASTNPFAHYGASWTHNWVQTVRAPFLAAPLDHIKNPNGQTGLQVHLDLGVAPSNSAHESQYGAFGTNSTQCVVRDHEIDITSPLTDGTLRLTINGVPGQAMNVGGLHPLSAFQALLSAAPAGGWPTGVPVTVRSASVIPTTTDSWRVRLNSTLPCSTFTMALDYAGTDPDASTKVTIREESNEALRSRNRSPYNEVDPVRRTRFRYAVITPGGQADSDRFNSSLSEQTFVHELGHTIGLEHWGRFEWPSTYSSPTNEVGQRNLTCLPHYRSIMSYGYQRPAGLPIRFAHEDNLVFNPARVDENQPFGPWGVGLPDFDQPGDWSHESSPWFYDATPTRVDFDRSGTMTVPGFLVRSTGLVAHQRECRGFMAGNRVLPSGAVRGSVDLARLGNLLFAFWVEPGGVYFRAAPLGAQGNKSCTGDKGGMDDAGNCLSWTDALPLIAGDFLGVSALRFGSELFVAVTHTNEDLSVHRFAPSGVLLTPVGTPWPLSIDSATRTAFAPELTLLHNANHAGRLALVYRSNLSSRYRVRHYDPIAQSWSAQVPVRTGPLGQTLVTGNQAAGSLVWPGPEMASWNESERRTLLVLPDTSANCRVYLLRPSGTDDTWDELPGWTTYKCETQPSLAVKTLRRQNGLPDANLTGHMMLVHAKFATSGSSAWDTPQVAFSTLVSRTNPPSTSLSPTLYQTGQPQLAPNDHYWGEWWTALVAGSNIAVYSDSTLDNVFALGAIQDKGDKLVFFPHGDGAPDFAFGANSDFRVMEDEVCRFLRYSAPTWDAGAVCQPLVLP